MRYDEEYGWTIVYYVLIGIHVVVCIFLVIVVLLQSGKAADLAGAFGGMGSQTTFGPRGSATVLSKATTIAAAIFMMTSLTLAIMATRNANFGAGGSVVDRFKTTKKAAPQPMPAAPAPTPVQNAQPPAQQNAVEVQPGLAAPTTAKTSNGMQPVKVLPSNTPPNPKNPVMQVINPQTGQVVQERQIQIGNGPEQPNSKNPGGQTAPAPAQPAAPKK